MDCAYPERRRENRHLADEALVATVREVRVGGGHSTSPLSLFVSERNGRRSTPIVGRVA
jgi:hypothetical protein